MSAGAGSVSVGAAAGMGCSVVVHESVSCLPKSVRDFNEEEAKRLYDNYKCFGQHNLFMNHFEKTRDGILTMASRAPKDIALILGVGSGRDIPLKELAAIFKRVCVVDIDFSTFSNALETVDAEDRSKIYAYQVDLSGYMGELAEKVEKVIEQIKAGSCAKKDLWIKINDLVVDLKRKEWIFPEGKASFVVASLVCSRLSGGLIEYIHSRYKKIIEEEAPLMMEKEEHSPELSAMTSWVDEAGKERVSKLVTFLTKLEGCFIENLSDWCAETGRVYFADHLYAPLIYKPSHCDESALKELLKSKIPHIASEKVRKVLNTFFREIASTSWHWALPHVSPEDGLCQYFLYYIEVRGLRPVVPSAKM